MPQGRLTNLLLTAALLQGDRGACRIVIRWLFERTAFWVKDRSAWDNIVDAELVTLHARVVLGPVTTDVDRWARRVVRQTVCDHLSMRASGCQRSRERLSALRLLQAYVSNDVAAGKKVQRRVRQLVGRYVRLAQPDDVVQEVTTRMGRAVRAGKLPRRPDAWARKIVSREVLRPRRVPIDPAVDLAHIADSRLRSDDDTLLNEEVKRTLRALGDADRSLLVMRFLDGMSFEDMAEELRTNVNTLKGRVSAAASRFRRIFNMRVRSDYGLGKTRLE